MPGLAKMDVIDDLRASNIFVNNLITSALKISSVSATGGAGSKKVRTGVCGAT